MSNLIHYWHAAQADIRCVHTKGMRFLKFKSIVVRFIVVDLI